MEDTLKTLNNLGMELIIKHAYKGIVFEVYRLKNCYLECYTYPVGQEWKRKYFARSIRPMDERDFTLYCMYNY